MILPDKVIRWKEGRVERTIEHMELRYGSADEGGWDDWLPVALVGPPANGVVTVEFLVDRHSPENAGLVAAVLQDIHFYLIDECQIPRPPDFAMGLRHLSL